MLRLLALVSAEMSSSVFSVSCVRISARPSFDLGTDSPVSTASLTMQLPSSSRQSQGAVTVGLMTRGGKDYSEAEENCWRGLRLQRLTMSPGTRWLLCTYCQVRCA